MSLWTSRASTSPELDRLEVRIPTDEEIERLIAKMQRAEDEGPFRCECLKCKLRRPPSRYGPGRKNRIMGSP